MNLRDEIKRRFGIVSPSGRYTTAQQLDVLRQAAEGAQEASTELHDTVTRLTPKN